MLAPKIQNTARFKTSKEELSRLSSEFHSEALPLLEKLYYTSFWILLNKRTAKKIVKETFLLAIEYCDKTKAHADWKNWIYRIWIRIVLDYYSSKENDINTIFDFIDFTQVNENEANNFLNTVNVKSNLFEHNLIEELSGLPAVLRIPLIMRETYNFNYEAISDLIDVPVGVIATRIYRARKLLILLGRENFDLGEQKKLDIDWRSNKIIFELRKTSLLIDDELPEAEKNEFNNQINHNAQYKIEVQIQQKVKSLFNNIALKDNTPRKLQSYIRKKAKKRFGSS